MDSNKRCKNCEWWNGEENSLGREICLRWPGDPWLRTYGEQRCWQWCKPEINRFKIHPEDMGKLVDPSPLGVVRVHKS